MLEYYNYQEMIESPKGGMVPSGRIIRLAREVPEVDIPSKEAYKREALDRITVTVSTGKVFYADPVSRADLADAIAIAQETGQTSTIWKLAVPINGTKWNTVTLAEIQEARALGLQEKGTIIGG